MDRSTAFSLICFRIAAPPTRRFPSTAAPVAKIFRPTFACEAGIDYAARESCHGLVPQSFEVTLFFGFLSAALEELFTCTRIACHCHQHMTKPKKVSRQNLDTRTCLAKIATGNLHICPCRQLERHSCHRHQKQPAESIEIKKHN